jgi:hypothetical protein
MLFLWGPRWSFFVSLDCSSAPPRVQLSAGEADAPKPFHRLLVTGSAEARAVWHALVSRMLEAEGIPQMTMGEIAALDEPLASPFRA